tara:strand:+ start:358 stop:1002 length:645 start_codon:yes stop_codon:yes gene_type:complete
MTIGIVGEKQGMTRVFSEEGVSSPVTVVSAEPNTITQIKSLENDGYSSVQVTLGLKKEKHLTKSEIGHFKKAGIEPGSGLWEFRVNSQELEESEEIEVGKTLSTEQFQEGQLLDVTGVSKGKGFAGTVKRWNFKMQDATHGNSISHRAPGSIGQCQTPGRVWKGKKMSGHMGFGRVTTQNLKLVSIDTENNLLLIKGAVPGPTGSKVIIKPSIK